MSTLIESKSVKIDQIFDNPFQSKDTTDRKGIDKLVSSIKQDGILQKPRLRQISKEKYQVIFGSRRIKSIKFIHESDPDHFKGVIDCQVMVDMSDEEHKRLTYSENAFRSDPHPIDKGKIFLSMLPDFDNRADLIADHFGLDHREVKQMIEYQKLPQEILDFWRSEILTQNHCKELLKISGGQQKKAFNACIRQEPDTEEWFLCKTVHELKDYISNMSTKMSLAAFNPKKKYKAKTSCFKCPNNSMNKGDLFSGLETNDIYQSICNDANCFSRKGTEHRAEIIKKFQKNETPFFIIHTGYGGCPYDIEEEGLKEFAVHKDYLEFVSKEEGHPAIYWNGSRWNGTKTGEVVYARRVKRNSKSVAKNNFFDKKTERKIKRDNEASSIVTDSRKAASENILKLPVPKKLTIEEWQYLAWAIINSISWNEGGETIKEWNKEKYNLGYNGFQGRHNLDTVREHLDTKEKCMQQIRVGLGISSAHTISNERIGKPSDYFHQIIESNNAQKKHYEKILKSNKEEAEAKWKKQDESRAIELEKLMQLSAMILDASYDETSILETSKKLKQKPEAACFGNDNLMGLGVLYDLSSSEGWLKSLEADEKATKKLMRAIGVSIKRGATNDAISKLGAQLWNDVLKKTIAIEKEVIAWYNKKPAKPATK